MQCQVCGTRNTPEWRAGPGGKRTLCNGCGLCYSTLFKKAIAIAYSTTPPRPSNALPLISTTLTADQMNQQLRAIGAARFKVDQASYQLPRSTTLPSVIVHGAIRRASPKVETTAPEEELAAAVLCSMKRRNSLEVEKAPREPARKRAHSDPLFPVLANSLGSASLDAWKRRMSSK